MLTKIDRIIAVTTLAVCAASLVVSGNISGNAQTQQSATEQVRSITPSERRGRSIYLRGESVSGREITPTIGDLEVPASTVQCAGCHGRKAEGKTEGGVSAGSLTWSNLTKTYGHTHPTGRKHGPFNDASFTMAVVHGVDPDHNRLAVAMPKYRMSPEDMADLIAYLKYIEFEQDPGLTAESIEVGVPLPTKGGLADVGAAMREVLAAYFDDLNSRGGIYNRQIKLNFTEGGDGGIEATFNSARSLAQHGHAFAFVSGLSAGADKQMVGVAADEEVPFVGPSTLLPQIGKPPNRYVFYLLPGAVEQARALINFAGTKIGSTKVHAAILYAEGDLTKAAGLAAIDQAQLHGWTDVTHRAYAGDSFDAARQAQALKQQGIEALFFFGSSSQIAALLTAAERIKWRPTVFLLGTLTSKDLANSVPSVFKERVFLAFPTAPSDITTQGGSEYRELLKKYKLTPRHPASQFTALAAAKIFVEGLKRAGADLSREQLVSALEGLYEFDTGLTPRIIFGPNRRVGAAGAYMVTVNPETKEFAAVGSWISAN